MIRARKGGGPPEQAVRWAHCSSGSFFARAGRLELLIKGFFPRKKMPRSALG